MNGRNSRTGAFSVGLYAMILAAALLLTVFGGRLYAAVTAAREENDLRRSTLAYVQTQIEAADAAGAVSILKGPEGDLLELTDSASGYATRIYLYEGALVEEFSPAEDSPDPARAQTICQADSFSVAAVNDSLISVTADGVRALAAVRSGGIAYG